MKGWGESGDSQVHAILNEVCVRLGVPLTQRRHREIPVDVPALANVTGGREEPAVLVTQCFVRVRARLPDAAEMHVQRCGVEVLEDLRRCGSMQDVPIRLLEALQSSKPKPHQTIPPVFGIMTTHVRKKGIKICVHSTTVEGEEAGSLIRLRTNSHCDLG